LAKAKEKPKGPSFSALAALATLAIALWLEVDLATAILRSVIVYLILSLVATAYKIVLGRYLAISQARAEREMLEKIQREAEEEERKKEQKRKQQEEEQKQAKASSGPDAQPVGENAGEPEAALSTKSETQVN
jgi:hypothetical protein